MLDNSAGVDVSAGACRVFASCRCIHTHRCRCGPYSRPTDVGAQHYGAVMTMSMWLVHGRV